MTGNVKLAVVRAEIGKTVPFLQFIRSGVTAFDRTTKKIS